MKKRFILLIDFSEYSHNLITYACDWSKQAQAELLLVHQSTVVAPALSNMAGRMEITKHTNNLALHKLHKLAKKHIPKEIHYSILVSESKLQLTINRLLTEPFDNLIFTGLKGTGPLKKVFLGSVTLKVIAETSSALVAMPKEISHFSHENLYVAVSEKHPLNVDELKHFLKFFNQENTNITFFYMAKPRENTTEIEYALKTLNTMFSEQFKTTIAIYKGQNTFAEIKKVINNKIEQMLIVQKGSRLLSDQLFRKFLVNDLVFEGQTPLVILP